MTTILALDLASVTGWAIGEPGGTPKHFSIRFATPGASHEAIFSNAMHWMQGMLSAYQPDLIVWEAPMPTSFNRGKTTSDATTILHGLPAVIGAAAYQSGIYDIRKAETRLVRHHFIGCNPKRAKAKPMVIRQCQAMGWDVADDAVSFADYGARDHSSVAYFRASAGKARRRPKCTTGLLYPFAHARICAAIPRHPLVRGNYILDAHSGVSILRFTKVAEQRR